MCTHKQGVYGRSCSGGSRLGEGVARKHGFIGVATAGVLEAQFECFLNGSRGGKYCGIGWVVREFSDGFILGGCEKVCHK